MLIKEFEKEASKKDIKTIDSYGTKFQINLFNNLGYQKVEEYVSFRKILEEPEKTEEIEEASE